MQKPPAKIIKETQSQALKRKTLARKKIEEMSESFADKQKFKDVWDLL